MQAARFSYFPLTWTLTSPVCGTMRILRKDCLSYSTSTTGRSDTTVTSQCCDTLPCFGRNVDSSYANAKGGIAMSMSRVTAVLSVLITASIGAIPAAAQQELHHVPPVVNADGYNPDYCQPFIEPMAFNPDFQFFAPAEVDTFGGGPEPHTGWFATYDRARIWVSRPDFEPSYTEGDFTWGNRFDVGYMTEEDHGWLFSFTHIDGPVAFDILPVERINVWNPLDEPNGIPDFTVDLRGGGGGGGGGGTNALPTTGYPLEDRNNPITNERHLPPARQPERRHPVEYGTEQDVAHSSAPLRKLDRAVRGSALREVRVHQSGRELRTV